MGEQLNDDTVEHLLSGNRDSDELGRLLGAIKAEFAAIDAPEPSPELRSFIDNATHAAGAAPAPTDELSIARKRRLRFAAVAATGTTLGKLMIGVSAAAASVAGMHATGLVDVPVLPDRGTPPESLAISDTNQPPPATLPATVLPEPSVSADTLYSFEAVDAGTVDIGVTNAEVVAAFANTEPGWKSQVSFTDTTVDIAFNRSGDTLDVRAVLDGDLLHVVITDHRTGTTEEFWLDNDSNPTLPDQTPQPEQPLESTPAPESTRTDDNKSDGNNSDDSTPATHDDTPDDDTSDDDQSDDDQSDDSPSDDDQPHDDQSDDESDNDQPDGESDDDEPDRDEPGDNDESDNDEPDGESDDDEPDDESDNDEPDNDTSNDDESDNDEPD